MKLIIVYEIRYIYIDKIIIRIIFEFLNEKELDV